MAKKKKNIKHILSDFTYTKPSLEKKFLDIKKNFLEISNMLNEKKK